MKEKPILFSAPMVEALLNTKPNTWPPESLDPSKPIKSMTRRVITRIKGFGPITEFGESTTPGYKYHFRDKHLRWNDVREIEPPWLPGDILWVREKWSCTGVGSAGNMNTAFIAYAADGGSKIIDVTPSRALYFAVRGRGQSPLFMPREAARITLEVTDVRIERVQEITNRDAIAEGMTKWLGNSHDMNLAAEFDINEGKNAVAIFSHLWDSLNAKRGYGWESNPWVWVYEFMRVT